MKKVVILTLVSIILLQPFSKMVIVMDYQLRKDFISKVLCENRNKPLMHCDGKCYLAKKLKLAEEREAKAMQGNLKEKAEQVFVYTSFDFPLPKYYKILTKKSVFQYLSHTYSSPLFSIFHPPKSVA